MEIAIGVVVVVILLVVAIVIIGRSLPVGHIASRTATFRRGAEEVWAALNDPALTSPSGGGLKFETVESLPPKRLVRRVVGDKDFGGTWTCEIASSPGGSSLTITENGEVYNSFFRFVSRYVIGHHRTIDGTMSALRKRFGES